MISERSTNDKTFVMEEYDDDIPNEDDNNQF